MRKSRVCHQILRLVGTYFFLYFMIEVLYVTIGMDGPTAVYFIRFDRYDFDAKIDISAANPSRFQENES